MKSTIVVCLFFILNPISFGQTTHFSFIGNTGNNATVLITTTANPNINDTILASGDEVGAFTPAGLCIGVTIWKNENTTITVWGDNDQTSEVDGIAVGEMIHFRIWDQSENKEYHDVDVTFDSDPPFNSSGTYAANGLYSLTSISALSPIEPILNISPSNQNVSYNSDTTTFIVTSNIEWSVSEEINWLTVYPTSGTGNETLTVICEENPNEIERVDTITVSGGGLIRKATITQSVAPFYLLVDSTELFLPFTADSTTFGITSNTNWYVDADAEWISLYLDSGFGNGVVSVYCAENTTTSERVGIIAITIKDGDQVSTVTVRQSAAPVILIVFPVERMVPYTADSTKFALTSNTSWNVIYDTDWLTIYPEGGNGDTALTCVFLQNTTADERVGTIVISAGDIHDTVRVIQEGLPTNVDVDPKFRTNTPREYVLYNNYPNPFNPATKIRYGIVGRTHATLKVYNVLGYEIATLVEETKPSGFYEVTFDASEIPSGIYFYRLKSENFIDTKKMLLLK